MDDKFCTRLNESSHPIHEIFRALKTIKIQGIYHNILQLVDPVCTKESVQLICLCFTG